MANIVTVFCWQSQLQNLFILATFAIPYVKTKKIYKFKIFYGFT